MREWQWHQLDCIHIICISQVNTSISALGLFVSIMADFICSNKLSEAGLMMHKMLADPGDVSVRSVGLLCACVSLA